jgi:hypothetical protein
MVIAGGLAFAAFVAFLPYEGAGSSAQTFWNTATPMREPIVVTAIAGVTVGFVFASFFTKTVVTPALAACLSFYLCGQWFYDGSANYTGLGVGFTLATGATVVMSVGGVLALVGYRHDAVTPPPDTSSQSASTAPTTPPPGWYPDPSQAGRERYWAGLDWTEQVRLRSGPP